MVIRASLVSAFFLDDRIRAIYRVLLTRRKRGTSLFVLDAETRAHVASRRRRRDPRRRQLGVSAGRVGATRSRPTRAILALPLRRAARRAKLAA